MIADPPSFAADIATFERLHAEFLTQLAALIGLEAAATTLRLATAESICFDLTCPARQGLRNRGGK